MNNNVVNSDDLNVELEEQEEILYEINKKIKMVLDKYDDNNREYENLLVTRSMMRKKGTKRSKMYIAVATVLGTIACLLVISILSESIKIFVGTKIVQGLLSFYNFIDGFLAIF